MNAIKKVIKWATSVTDVLLNEDSMKSCVILEVSHSAAVS